MSRFLAMGGLAVAAAGGYVLGRRGDDVRVAVERALHRGPGEQKTEISLTVTSKPSYDTEFDHVAEHEHEERHRVAEEIKGHPLHERERRPRGRQRELDPDRPTSGSSHPHRPDRDDRFAPRTL